MDCSETFIDKSKWPPGPWQVEPDKVEFVDIDTGLPCVIRRHNEMGHLCGYVHVPEGNPYCRSIAAESNIRLTLAEDELHVHGGITFEGEGFEKDGDGNPGLTHSLVRGGWWVGFDAAHAYDLIPGMSALLPDGRYPHGLLKDVYRDLEYMKGECRNLARQISEKEW